MKQKMIELQELEKPALQETRETPLTRIERTSRTIKQIISNDIENMYTINQFDIIDIYRKFHPTTVEHRFFLKKILRSFFKIKELTEIYHILPYNSMLSEFERI